MQNNFIRKGEFIMTSDLEKLMESKNMIQKMANGINPLNETPIETGCFLNDPQIIRPLFFIIDYISNEVNKKPKRRKKPTQFYITNEQISAIELPSGKIGVNNFARAVNAVIDPNQSKKLQGLMINRKLKLLGILSETVDEDGKKRTTTNDRSEGYGIESITKLYNGQEYQQVVFNEDGKEFLLKNIVDIMNYQE